MKYMVFIIRAINDLFIYIAHSYFLIYIAHICLLEKQICYFLFATILKVKKMKVMVTIVLSISLYNN